MKNKHSLLALFVFISCQISAQNIGQHAIQDWQIIKSKVCNVIFPKGMEDHAARIADVINYQKENNSASVGPLAKKINIVLQNQSVIPNGNVQLSPFRSNFLGTAPQAANRLGSLDWLDILSVHEYRHVQQISNGNQGLVKVLSTLLGQEAWLTTLFIAVPEWYFEGDAVVAETSMSSAGRGRMPAFSAQQRALALAGKNYTYQKNRNRSLKDAIPNQYPLGYMMVTHLKNKKGNDIMTPILKDAAKFKGGLYPFNNAMKRNASIGTIELYHEAWEEAKKKWKKQRDELGILKTDAITNKPKKTNTSYWLPQLNEEGGILAMKNSFKETDQLVKIEDGIETKIVSVGIQIGPYFHYNNKKAVWNELTQAPRRNNTSYNDLVLYDFEKKTKTRITKKGKYFSPILTNDGHIFAIESKPDLSQSIVKWDSKSKQFSEVGKFENNVFISRLCLDESKGIIIYIKKVNSELALEELNLNTRKKRTILPATAHIISVPRIHDDYVYYSASFNGIDNVYRTPLNGDQSIEQISSVAIGAYHPVVDAEQNRIIFTEHTERGRVISSMDMSSKKGKIIALNEPVDMEWLDEIAAEAEKGNLLTKVDNNQYESEKYKGGLSGLKLHGWIPSLSSEEVGINLLAGNYLQDLSVSVFGGYDLNAETPISNARISYAKFYPILSLNTELFPRTNVFVDQNGNLKILDFTEFNYGPEISLPHNWIKGNYLNEFTPSIGFNRHHNTDRVLDDVSLADEYFNSVYGTLSFYSYKRLAVQHIAPRLGIRGFVSYAEKLDSDDQFINANGRIYFPGIGKNHSLRVSGAYKKELFNSSFRNTSNFEMHRGYKSLSNQEIHKLSLDYSFPLMYPDFGIAGITYFKRIRANMFYDHGTAEDLSGESVFDLQSAGLEIIFDNTILNFAEIYVSFGFRGSYLFKGDPNNRGKDLVFGFFFANDF